MSALARQLLADPVPPGGTQEFKDWKLRYASLRDEPNHDEIVALLLAALEHGRFAAQQCALLGFRFFLGYEAWAEDYPPRQRYEVTSPDRSRRWIVTPKLQTLEEELGAA